MQDSSISVTTPQSKYPLRPDRKLVTPQVNSRKDIKVVTPKILLIIFCFM